MIECPRCGSSLEPVFEINDKTPYSMNDLGGIASKKEKIMKAKIYETDFVMGIDLEAETLEEAVWITRFPLNVKREIPRYGSTASKDGTFSQYISFYLKKDKTSRIS
jgi:hypothetical protein